MNKHIELVKKWLNDPNSVTKEQLGANFAAADAAANAADAAANAAYAAYAAYATAATAETEAAYWVKKYEEMTDA